jgi:predicted  nucleic acid-binding Zn-ribbon protein
MTNPEELRRQIVERKKRIRKHLAEKEELTNRLYAVRAHIKSLRQTVAELKRDLRG